MKKNSFFFMLLYLLPTAAFSQNLNWENLSKKQRHIVSAAAGVEHGTVVSAGYSYQLHTTLPLLLHAGYSMPAGKKLVDDFKVKSGAALQFLHWDDIYVAARLDGIFRRYENSFVRLLNFGADISTTAGYYKPAWFVAGEAGFDKAIITNFKHSSSFKALYPLVTDGWYEPASGGNFYFGLQTGFSITNTDIYLKAGRFINEDLKTAPDLPFFLEAGVNVKLQ